MPTADEGHPPNGGTAKEALQRIEAKADQASVLARGAVMAVEQLRDLLVGNPAYGWDHGRMGRFEEKFDKFVVESNSRQQDDTAGTRFRISNRLAAASVILLALGILASIILTVLK